MEFYAILEARTRREVGHGASNSTIFSGCRQGAEHLSCGGVAAPFPAHPFHPAQGAGGGTGQAAADSGNEGVPQGAAHRRGNDPSQAGGGNSHAGAEGQKRGTDDGCLHCGRRLHRRGRDGYHPVFCPRGKAHEKKLPRHSLSHFQRKCAVCDGAAG